jgi:hypothetical protein
MEGGPLTLVLMWSKTLTILSFGVNPDSPSLDWTLFTLLSWTDPRLPCLPCLDLSVPLTPVLDWSDPLIPFLVWSEPLTLVFDGVNP